MILEPEVFGDARGYFFESFSRKRFEETAGAVDFVQDNESKSRYGVVRGLHFQHGEAAQAKLVRVVSGRVLDVAVDIRRGSPTFGRHVASGALGRKPPPAVHSPRIRTRIRRAERRSRIPVQM